MHLYHRLVNLGNDLNNLRFRGTPIKATWRTVYIQGSPHYSASAESVNSLLRLNATPQNSKAPPFRVPRWLVGAFISLNMLPTSGVVPKRDQIWASFHDGVSGERIHFCFGLCTKRRSQDLYGMHWAWVEPKGGQEASTPDWRLREHSCEEDHVEAWDSEYREKDFGDANRTVRVSVAPCEYTPKTTLVLHMELRGRVYKAWEKVLSNAPEPKKAQRPPQRPRTECPRREVFQSEPSMLGCGATPLVYTGLSYGYVGVFHK